MKYDVTTSHCFTQHWEVEARSKEQAGKKIMEGDIKFDNIILIVIYYQHMI